MSKQPYPSDQDILCVRKKVWMTWAVLIDQELIKLVVRVRRRPEVEPPIVDAE